MPFWKKSEDPWDIDPNKQRRPPVETEETGESVPGLLKELRDWNEARKEEKVRQEALLPPMPCPWCEKEMETSYLFGGRDGVHWRTKRPGKLAYDPDTQMLDTDGSFWNRYKRAWYCPDCGKLVLDIRPGQDDSSVSQSDRDCEEELRRYAEQAKKK